MPKVKDRPGHLVRGGLLQGSLSMHVWAAGPLLLEWDNIPHETPQEIHHCDVDGKAGDEQDRREQLALCKLNCLSPIGAHDPHFRRKKQNKKRVAFEDHRHVGQGVIDYDVIDGLND